jgi:outer membrane lipoprotein carrier protein
MLLISIAVATLSFASQPVVVSAAPAPVPAPVRAPVPAPAPAPRKQSVDAVILRAQNAWARVKTLRASFEQTVTNPITGSALTSRGDLQQRKPNRLAITFSDPKGDRIVADGEYVWVFLQSATPGQVIRMTNATAGAANTDLIGQFLNTPRSKYDATDAGAEQVGRRSARAIMLVAKPGQALPFVRAKVWVDSADALIRQFESTDANGITRRVRLLTLSPNARVDTAAFRFRVPADVRVVTP